MRVVQQYAATAFVFADVPEQHQAVIHLIGILDQRRGFVSYAPDRCRIERAEIGRGLGIEPAAAEHRLRAAFLQRRVVEEGVRPRVQSFLGQGRRLRQVARMHAYLASLQSEQQPLQAVDVHGFVQAIADRLIHQGMVGDLAVSSDVLGACELVGKHNRHQILRLHTLQLRRYLLTAARTENGQCAGGIPTPAHGEHRCGEQGLGQHVAYRR